MSGFAADWLRLREPYDGAARNRRALAALVRWAGARPALRAVDLGGGSGSNVRFLAPRLGGRQSWTIVDHDAALLPASAEAVGTGRPVAVAARRLDLASGLDWLEAAPVDLVTASALLDLVSGHWLDRLCAAGRAQRCALHFALSYDGTIRFDPADPVDARVVSAVNRDQRRDKGFGPALGPEAAPRLARTLRGLGYAVVTGASPWRLGPADRAIQRRLVGFWAECAAAVDPAAARAIGDWRARRGAWIDSGRSALAVGHGDVTALPPA